MHGLVGRQQIHYDLVYVTTTGATSLGTVNGKDFPYFVASPDGHWLAHFITYGPLYLLYNPSP